MTAKPLQHAIGLCKAGEKEKAAILLRHILRSEPDNETAWLWLADAQPDMAGRVQVLREFQAARPDSRIAQAALQQMAAQSKPGAPRAKPAEKSTAQKSPERHPPSSNAHEYRILFWVFGGIILLGVVVFLVLWALRGMPAAVEAPRPDPTSTAEMAPRDITPHFLPTQAPTPTRSECDCAEALAYLERSGERIINLGNESLMAAEYLEHLPGSQVDFATLSGLGRARYDTQFSDQPPPCLISFHQKLITYFASWWHAMQAISNGEYNNAAIFLTSFREKEAEIYAEAQELLDRFRQCAPPQDGTQNQTGAFPTHAEL